MKMNEFKAYHPIVNFIYYVFVIGFSCLFMHPVCLFASFSSAFLYSVMLKGKNAAKTNLYYMLPMLIFVALLNPAFNHRGVTILAYFPSGNPLTLESIIYGISSAIMLLSVVCHFFCYSEIMQSDKFIYLFGRIIPSLSLVFSMTLRFVPRFIHQMKLVSSAQKSVGRGVTGVGIVKGVKNAASVFSVMVSWSLENAIDTADSMKSRGYGLKGRTSFSVFSFCNRDKAALLLIGALGGYIIFGAVLGALEVSFYPSIVLSEPAAFGTSVLIAYFALCFMPVMIELWEVRRWKATESKI